MRLPAFLVLAFVASGCTIHVVEQPATPVLVAEAPRPVRHHHVRRAPVAVAPTPAPAAAPPRTHAPAVVMPARATRIPAKALMPKARPTHLARLAPPARKHRPQKVKRPDPPAKLSSTSVAKAQ